MVAVAASAPCKESSAAEAARTGFRAAGSLRAMRASKRLRAVAARSSTRARGKGSAATGAQRKKAIVAVARQLAVDLWRLHTSRCTAEQLGFKI